MKTVFVLFGLLMVCLPALSKSLCNSKEKLVFSCELDKKNVSVCLTRNGSVEYVYGSEGKVELALDSPVFSRATCVGGGISRLRFQDGNVSYIVYDAMCQSQQISENQWSKADVAGWMVLNKGKPVANKVCTNFDDNVFGINSAILPENVEKERFNYDLP